MSTVCVLKVGAFWACSLQKGLQQDRIACLAGQVRLPAPADIFESAERNYWDQRCPDTTASLEDSNGNLELAVAFLTAKNAKTPQQEETTYYQTVLPGSDRYISVGSQADANVIDLTGDDKDDLQRAIALSLAESNRAFRETGMTDEEQAISRVLEASIAENKACLKRTPTEVWRDSRNPYDRKRQDKAPVGLKNVGNTCWFSAVIQQMVK
nr:ubiquitin carboxyl-terminal hydrolase 25-like isoform X4 [Equus asinus]